MNTLQENKQIPEKLTQNGKLASLMLHKGGVKSIEIRRAMINSKDVARVLTQSERYIFIASTKKQICEIDDSTLVEKTSQLFRYIAKDIGYMIPTDSSDWIYTCTRLLDYLKRYYSQLTLSDVKLAFELLVTGEMDEYLPRDKDGNPEKKHYQQFNADYFARILNAYKKKQNQVITKAYEALPRHENKIDDKQVKEYKKQAKNACLTCFLRYKYTGRFIFEFVEEMIVYNWLFRVGLADELEETEEDRKKAFSMFLSRVAKGFVNKSTAYQVRKEGINSKEIDYTTFEIMRRKEIKLTFDRMIKEELQVMNYLKFD